jgi:hypothetical protein
VDLADRVSPFVIPGNRHCRRVAGVRGAGADHVVDHSKYTPSICLFFRHAEGELVTDLMSWHS